MYETRRTIVHAELEHLVHLLRCNRRHLHLNGATLGVNGFGPLRPGACFRNRLFERGDLGIGTHRRALRRAKLRLEGRYRDSLVGQIIFSAQDGLPLAVGGSGSLELAETIFGLRQRLLLRSQARLLRQDLCL